MRVWSVVLQICQLSLTEAWWDMYARGGPPHPWTASPTPWRSPSARRWGQTGRRTRPVTHPSPGRRWPGHEMRLDPQRCRTDHLQQGRRTEEQLIRGDQNNTEIHSRGCNWSSNALLSPRQTYLPSLREKNLQPDNSRYCPQNKKQHKAKLTTQCCLIIIQLCCYDDFNNHPQVIIYIIQKVMGREKDK